MIFWKCAAMADRQNIIQFIAKDDRKAAIKLGDAIMEKTLALAVFPELGRVGMIKGTRELIVHLNYLIIYRVLVTPTETRIEILRIKHAKQQMP